MQNVNIFCRGNDHLHAFYAPAKNRTNWVRASYQFLYLEKIGHYFWRRCISHSQHFGCEWPGDGTSEGITARVDRNVQKYSGLSTRVVNMQFGHYFTLGKWILLSLRACAFFSVHYWGWMTHICVGNLTTIGSDNGSSPSRRQAIIWTNAGILLIWPLETNFS